jgi:hypothetical protein
MGLAESAGRLAAVKGNGRASARFIVHPHDAVHLQLYLVHVDPNADT